jgi:hypothetical protein
MPMSVILRLLVDEYLESGRLVGESELPQLIGRKRS